MLNIHFISKNGKVYKSDAEDMPYLPMIGDCIRLNGLVYKIMQRVFLPKEREIQIFVELE